MVFDAWQALPLERIQIYFLIAGLRNSMLRKSRTAVRGLLFRRRKKVVNV